MSKTKDDKTRLSVGIDQEISSRQGYSRFKTTINPDAPDGSRIEQVRENFNQYKCGKERIIFIVEGAQQILRDKGLPTGSIVEPIEEFKSENLQSVKNLQTIISQMGYKALDDEYLLAEIIDTGRKVLNPSNAEEHIIEASFQLGKLVERMAQIKKKDFISQRPRDRRSLKPFIKEAFEELGSNVSARDVHFWLKKKGIIQLSPDEKSYDWDGGSTSISRFENLVSEIRKKLHA